MINELIESAEAGDVDAQYKLGNIYFEGQEGIQENIPEAIKWLEMAADNNDSASQYLLARIFLLIENPVLARKWAEKALENGHSFNPDVLESLGFK